jgi:hypothetical protein
MELLVLAAIAYAAARGIEQITDDFKASYKNKVADATVKKAAKNTTTPTATVAGVAPGSTFSAKEAAPRTATIGTKTAAAIAAGVQAGATFRKSYLEGYREAWPTAREEAQKRQVEKAKRRQAEHEARAAERRAEAAEKKAADAKTPPPAAIVVTTVPPKTETTPPKAAPAKPEEKLASTPAATPPAEVQPVEPQPMTDVPAKPSLVLVKDPNPNPAPAPIAPGDTVTIPEVRTLDGLLHALQIINAVSLMRAEEAAAIAADDAQLAAQLDAFEASLADQEVDTKTLAEIGALRELISVQATTAQQYQAAAQNAADMASGTASAAHKSHGGINEAVQSSPIPAAAQAGYYER